MCREITAQSSMKNISQVKSFQNNKVCKMQLWSNYKLLGEARSNLKQVCFICFFLSPLCISQIVGMLMGGCWIQ